MRLPHPLALLLGCTLVAAALTWVLPAGEYQRRDDPATGRSVVVAGTYHAVPAAPVGFGRTMLAVPRGLVDAASVVIVILLVGGALVVVDRTGALHAGTDSLVRALTPSGAGPAGPTAAHGTLVVVAVSLVFAVGGVLIGLQEEVVGLIPVLLVLATRLGYDPITAVAMSLGAAVIGGAFSPVNPFGVGVAQKLAELPLVSGWAIRLVALAAALAVWIGGTLRHARRGWTRGEPTEAAVEVGAGEPAQATRLSARHAIVLLLVLAAFATYVFGALRLDWGFDEMSALFLVLGITAGLAGGLRVSGTADAYVHGFREMVGAAVLVGVARSIYLVLEQGKIVDTIVHGLLLPLEGLPATMSALGMLVVHSLVHVPVPSTSGQAVLTIPIVTPLADLIGLGRQVAVLAYQYGAGLADLFTPTNGALMAVLAGAGVRYDRWLRFVAPLFVLAMLVAAATIVVAVAIGA